MAGTCRDARNARGNEQVVFATTLFAIALELRIVLVNDSLSPTCVLGSLPFADVVGGKRKRITGSRSSRLRKRELVSRGTAR